MSTEKPLFVRQGAAFRQVKPESIAFLRAEDNYARMHLTSGEDFIVYSSLQAFEKTLRSHRFGPLFVRVHRSYLVNVAAIDKWNVEASELHINNLTLPLSRQKRKVLEAALTLLG